MNPRSERAVTDSDTYPASWSGRLLMIDTRRTHAFDMVPESGHTGRTHVAALDDLDLRLL